MRWGLHARVARAWQGNGHERANTAGPRSRLRSEPRARVGATLVGATLLAAPAFAEEPATAQPQAAEAAPTRSVWLAPSYQLLLTDAFEPSSRHGLGLAASYQFHISPKFNLGLVLAYRLYPGSEATQQLGYGVILEHFFSPDWSTRDGFYPYVDYGLLLQQTYVGGRSGSAVSHDTRLGVGAVLRGWGIPLFAEVAGHYSRLQFFDTDSVPIPYLELEFGWAHAF
jgi:hypothetical protein